MTDSVLTKYTRKPDDSGEATEADEDLGSFGWLRGMRERATMLELRDKDGNITAIGYAYIEKMEFDPSVGITLHALGKVIKIEGRNLNTAYDLLVARKKFSEAVQSDSPRRSCPSRIDQPELHILPRELATSIRLAMIFDGQVAIDG